MSVSGLFGSDDELSGGEDAPTAMRTDTSGSQDTSALFGSDGEGEDGSEPVQGASSSLERGGSAAGAKGGAARQVLGPLLKDFIDSVPSALPKVRLVKLSNLMSIGVDEFTTEEFERECDALEEEGDTEIQKHALENTVRWRDVRNSEGEIERESNTRLVTWSDGTQSLVIGEEMFDVAEKNISSDNTHLYEVFDQFLLAHAVLDSKLAFQPVSTQSMTHKRLTAAVASRVSKPSRVNVLFTAEDPEKQRQESIRQEDERIRAKARREGKQRKRMEQSQTSALSASYLEDKFDDNDDDTINLKNIRDNVLSGKSRRSRDFDDEAADRRINRAKNYADDDD